SLNFQNAKCEIPQSEFLRMKRPKPVWPPGNGQLLHSSDLTGCKSCGAIPARFMSSFFPTDDAPTIARNPSRSLWEAGLVGHHDALAQILGRCSPAIYAWMRARGMDPVQASSRTENFVVRLQTQELPDAQAEEVGRLQDFLLRRL